jgi:signal transduction histidine kinase
VTAALVLGVRLAALAGGAGLTLLAGAVLRAGGWPPRAASVESERLVWLLSLTLTLGLLGFIGGHLTRRLARTERELAGAHGRLARSLQRLARAHRALQEAYARLAAAESQLVAVEKMRAFGVLIAGVAHELGNPLAVLAGNLDPIEQMVAAYEAVVPTTDERGTDGPRRAAGAALDLDEWRREAPVLLANCREATERAVALLAKLRRLGTTARRTELRLAPLRPGLESTVALVRHRLPPGVRVVARYDDVPEVSCDPAELNQVFMNLLLNAADALRPGGTLAVELLRQGGEVTVVVRDDGPGIAPAILPRIFEPFFTTKGAGQGSGLGLAISRTIVDRHGGRLEVRTPADGGAELVVALPLPGSAPEIGRRTDVESVAQTVAQEVECEHRHHDRDAGDDREMRCDEQEGAAVVQHRPP